MSDTFNVIAKRIVPDTLKLVSMLEPPAWTRLEPVSESGDPTPGLQMALLDPLWSLGRQWQFGELRGEDAGTPLSVTVQALSQSITAWVPGDVPSSGTVGKALPVAPNVALEPLVEAEGLTAGRGPGWRLQAEAGQVLVQALLQAGLDARTTLVAAFALPVDVPPPAGMRDGEWPKPRLWKTIARTAPDAEQVAVSLEQARPGLPAWLAAAPATIAAAVQQAAADWLVWYRSQVAPLAAASTAWIPDRLEYRFAVRVGGPTRQQVLVAPLHDGGSIDWSSFDAAPQLRILADREVVQPPTAPPTSLTPADLGRTQKLSMLASPLRFHGMPSDRLWQFEDGRTNLGRLEVQRHDLARLCFTEFAMIYGNDWFSVPLDVPAGSFTRIQQLSYTTTFGEQIVVPPADDTQRGGTFRLFETSIVGSRQTINGLLTPPTARGPLEGRPLEDVLLLRDEGANMAWAVERTVQGPSGDPYQRSDEPRPSPARPGRLPDTDLQYLFASTVPHHWIPLVPVPNKISGFFQGGFKLRKGTVSDVDDSRGVLMQGMPVDLKDEEICREGVRVRRVPAMVRGPMGERIRWVTRQISVGRGEGDSGLRFDEASG